MVQVQTIAWLHFSGIRIFERSTDCILLEEVCIQVAEFHFACCPRKLRVAKLVRFKRIKFNFISINIFKYFPFTNQMRLSIHN